MISQVGVGLQLLVFWTQTTSHLRVWILLPRRWAQTFTGSADCMWTTDVMGANLVGRWEGTHADYSIHDTSRMNNRWHSLLPYSRQQRRTARRNRYASRDLLTITIYLSLFLRFYGCWHEESVYARSSGLEAWGVAEIKRFRSKT